MEIKNIEISKIKPYEKNPRNNDKAVAAVANSIKEFGWQQPIVVDKNGVIIAGHTRYKAALKLGEEYVPVVYAEGLTEEQVKAYRLADNKVAELADWDFSLLDFELGDIFDIDMSKFGFLIGENKKTKKEQEIETENIQERAKRGDIFLLGKHKIMCGDSTEEEDVKTLMDEEVADLVFTDPPYGMGKEKDGVTNDNLNETELLKFNKKWIPLSFKYLKGNGSWYCWGIDEPLMDIYSEILKPMIKENKITFRNLITWDKGRGQGQNSHLTRMYAPADEKCLFVMCGVQGFNNNSENFFEGFEPIRRYLCDEAENAGLNAKKLKEICGVGMFSHWFGKSQWVLITEEHYKKLQEFYKNDFFRKDYNELKKDYNELKKEFEKTRAYFDNTYDNMNNVWHFERAGKEERVGHATPKPIALCERAIKTSSREGELVLDLFGGSGSTIIACENIGRKCFCMEYEPKWVDVIINRWENATGEKAILLNGD